jgi:hypothetical protein
MVDFPPDLILSGEKQRTVGHGMATDLVTARDYFTGDRRMRGSAFADEEKSAPCGIVAGVEHAGVHRDRAVVEGNRNRPGLRFPSNDADSFFNARAVCAPSETISSNMTMRAFS